LEAHFAFSIERQLEAAFQRRFELSFLRQLQIVSRTASRISNDNRIIAYLRRDNGTNGAREEWVVIEVVIEEVTNSER